jgi:hypothetical protein
MDVVVLCAQRPEFCSAAARGVLICAATGLTDPVMEDPGVVVKIGDLDIVKEAVDIVMMSTSPQPVRELFLIITMMMYNHSGGAVSAEERNSWLALTTAAGRALNRLMFPDGVPVTMDT